MNLNSTFMCNGMGETMKRFLLAIVATVFLAGCITTQPPAQLPAQIVKLQIEGVENVKVSSEENKIARSMEVANPELQFSRSCKIHAETGYITINSISSYGSEDLWYDFQLLRLKGVKKAVIYLNSPGGEAFQGMAIADEFRLAKGDIYVTIEGRGLIASAAIPVLLMADKRVVSRNTVFLIHPSKMWKWGFFAEGLRELKSQTRMFEILEARYIQILVDRSKITKEKAVKMMDMDTWFLADQAKAWGMVDEVI